MHSLIHHSFSLMWMIKDKYWKKNSNSKHSNCIVLYVVCVLSHVYFYFAKRMKKYNSKSCYFLRSNFRFLFKHITNVSINRDIVPFNIQSRYNVSWVQISIIFIHFFFRLLHCSLYHIVDDEKNQHYIGASISIRLIYDNQVVYGNKIYPTDLLLFSSFQWFLLKVIWFYFTFIRLCCVAHTHTHNSYCWELKLMWGNLFSQLNLGIVTQLDKSFWLLL